MYTFKYGGKKGTQVQLDIADDLVVVRTRENKALPEAIKSKTAKKVLTQLSPVVRFPEAGVSVLQCKQTQERLTQLRDQARQVFKKEKDVRFAGRVLRDVDTGTPVIYTENFFVKFNDDLSDKKCRTTIAKYQLQVKKKLKYAKNAFFVSAPEGTGLDVFRIAQSLLDDETVELCHPELIRQASRRSIATQQWHLQKTTINGTAIDAHVNVAEAWKVAKGQDIIIAVIDDGVDIDHEEFDIPGKVVHPRDVTQSSNDPRPKDQFYAENHGTACAGVACAAGNYQASGVAPEAKLMPIRLASNLGSQAEADAFEWASDHGADVISCSWGPTDGQWWNPNDSRHNQKVLLPDSTRLAIDYAVLQGRNGKGCVITWAAGNGNESVENDGYASYDKVIAVAASNDRNTRSVYSDFGESVWCSFPSSDFDHQPFDHPAPYTPGIWTTDREGSAGYNPGVLNPSEDNPPGDDHGNYTENFGGTSSACPGVAGIAALILAANRDLRWDEVKEILHQSAVRIDEASGSYDSEGHSPFYGYGRPDAERAVKLAAGDTGVKYEKLALQASKRSSLKETGDQKLYAIDLPAAATITLDGPEDNDFDLYAKRDSPPTRTNYDLRGYSPQADEVISVNPQTPGLYYILVYSYKGQGKFTLKVELT
jgi:subtilisin family serine protease